MFRLRQYFQHNGPGAPNIRNYDIFDASSLGNTEGTQSLAQLFNWNHHYSDHDITTGELKSE